jgi:hypothetical protein
MILRGVSIVLRVHTPPSLGRMRFNNSQHGSAASPPIIPAMKLGSGKLKIEFHNSPAIQPAASIAAMVSSRRCQIGHMGRIACFKFISRRELSPLPCLLPAHPRCEDKGQCGDLSALVAARPRLARHREGRPIARGAGHARHADYERLSFFEAEPTLLDANLPWFYNTLDFETQRNGVAVQ